MPSTENSVLQQIIKATRIILPCTLVFLAMDIWPFFTDPLSRGQTIGRDAYNFWAAGMLAFEGRTSEIYNNEAFSLAIKQLLGPEAGQHVFPYPPTALLGVAVFGWLSYEATLFLWSIGGFIAFLIAINAPNFERNILWLTILTPLTWTNIVLGQNGLFSAALFIGGLRLAHSRPIFAGILIGCLAYKPTLALLIPLVLLFERRWKVIFSATITLLTLCILPALIWGQEIWVSYLYEAVPFQRMLLEYGTGLSQFMKLTPFMSAHLLDFDLKSAYIIQAFFGLSTIIVVFIYFLLKKNDTHFSGLDITILATATVILIPYTHFYDLTLIAGGLLLLSKESFITKNNFLIKSNMITILYTIPIIGLLSNLFYFPISPLILFVGLLTLSLQRVNPPKRHKKLI